MLENSVFPWGFCVIGLFPSCKNTAKTKFLSKPWDHFGNTEMASSNKLLNTICEALGLPGNVRAVQLNLRVGEVPEVTVELLLLPNMRAGMVTFQEQLLTYKLFPADEQTAVADFQRAIDQ
jgi:hypothetical protein